MMMMNRLLSALLLISSLAACTGRVDVADLASDPDRDAQANCVGPACAACVLPWGGTLPGGESLNAVYTTDLAACGTSCMDNRLEMRCQLAKLQVRRPGQEYVDIGETKVVRSCWQRRCDCDHGGVKVEDGTSARFYKPSVMTCGTACESKMLMCAGGVMKDAATTSPDPAAPSIFTSSLCNNTCRTCTLPDGTTLNHGASTARYKAATAPCGTSCSSLVMSLSCNDGTLNGNPALYPSPTCANPTNCQTCTTPDGVKLQNGERYSFFRLQNVPCGTSCYANNNQVTLTCASGQFGDRALYPEHRFAACESACDPTGPKGDKSQGRITGDGGGAPVWFCGLPWGSGVVTHGTQVTAYSRMKVARTDKCTNYKSLITCNGYRGLWSGGGVFIYPSCKEDP
ncbi:MAG: hypothetical protein KF767_02715 [Bdellovibrionaceae bacterium]|nr:hypothetical protein [Pseudobdellovibrionaceae bacterium]